MKLYVFISTLPLVTHEYVSMYIIMYSSALIIRTVLFSLITDILHAIVYIDTLYFCCSSYLVPDWMGLLVIEIN